MYRMVVGVLNIYIFFKYQLTFFSAIDSVGRMYYRQAQARATADG